MRVLQVLPALDAGGVERGTVEFARELVSRGHESWVMSTGGRLVPQLVAEGSSHLAFPVHAKSLKSLGRVRALRRELQALRPDLIHVRSRIPAWMVWLALKKLPADQRPALVSTFHGLYSVSRYSAIMGCGDQVIAISHCVRDYIAEHYPHIDQARVTVIHRGVDTRAFHPGYRSSPEWEDEFFRQYPQLAGQPLLLMPGRLSPWKGQREFIELVAELLAAGVQCRGVIVGEPTPGKNAYLTELRARARELGLGEAVTFLGHRSDMADIYAHAAVVLNLSRDPEPFGRTVIEALAMGVPVVAYNSGGPAESLRDCLPEGLVPQGDAAALRRTVTRMLQAPPAIALPASFTLQAQTEATLAVYRKALAGRAAAGG